MRITSKEYVRPRVKYLAMDSEAPFAMSRNDSYSPNPSYAKENQPADTEADNTSAGASIWEE